MSEALLTVRGVTAFYGRVMALKGVDLEVRDGEIVTLIGANGAGKSTLMMTICGNPRAREGSIRSTVATSRKCRRTRSRSCGSRRRRKAAASSRA